MRPTLQPIGCGAPAPESSDKIMSAGLENRSNQRFPIKYGQPRYHGNCAYIIHAVIFAATLPLKNSSLSSLPSNPKSTLLFDYSILTTGHFFVSRFTAS